MSYLKDRYRLMNFTGTVLWKDIPILDCSIVNGEVLQWELHLENEKYYLWEFQYDPTMNGLQKFIDGRIMPPTRQFLQDALESIGLTEYSQDGIIRANYGLCTDDCYWFRPADSGLKYEDIKIRD